MSINDPDERASGARQRGSFTSTSPHSPSLDDLNDQYSLDDPMRPKPARAKWSPKQRFIIGILIFSVSNALVTFLLEYVDLRFRLNLSQPLMGGQLDWLNWFTIIYCVVFLGLWIILKRLGFFPIAQRDD